MRRFFVAGFAIWLVCSVLLSGTTESIRAQDGVVLGDAPYLQNGAVIAASGTDIVTAASIPAADISTRQSSANFYATYYIGQPASGWTGSQANCNAGTTSAAFKAAVIDRIAFYRAMAGVPTDIGLSETSNAAAQQAALMFSRNNLLSHYPESSWACYSASGAQGARSSNIVLGYYGVSAIDIYMDDPGGQNTAAGHRRWILYPQTQSFGTGDIPGGGGYSSANALWVWDNNASSTRPATRDGFVAWPPPGYVPSPLLSSRWSFSYPGANFGAASVSVTRDGSPISVSIDSATENGYGENTIVFRPDPGWWNLDVDQRYRVTIAGVSIGGENRSFTYDVIIFDPSTSGSPGTRTPTPSTSGYAPGDLFKTTTSLSLRTGPSTSASRITVLPNGTMGTVTGNPVAAGGYTWYPVTIGGFGSGWAAGEYFARVAATPTPVSTRTPTTIPTRTPTTIPTRTSTRPPSTATSTPTLLPGGFAPGDRVSTTTKLNLRNGPSTSATAIAVLPSGTSGQITGAPVFANGYTWYPITVTGYGSGWTAGEYLARLPGSTTATPTRTSTPSIPPTSTPKPTRAPGGFLVGDIVRTTDSVNFRVGPGTGNRVITVIAPNSQATITGTPTTANGYTWYPLTISGAGSGWIASDFLTLVSAGNPSPTATSTPAESIVYTTANLNIRTGPGTGFTSRGVAAKGSAARVTGATVQVGSVLWYPLEVPGIGSGWASGTYLSTSPVVYAPQIPPATPGIDLPLTGIPAPTATSTPIIPATATDRTEISESDVPVTSASPQPVEDRQEEQPMIDSAIPAAVTSEWLPIERVQRSANAQPGQTLVDNDPSTVWFADGAGQPLAMVVLDLGQNTTFSQIRWLPGDQGLSGALYLAISSDGENWIDLDPTLALTTDDGWQILETPTQAHYVRFVFVNDTGLDWLGGVAEIRIMP